jgi:hypothetical protein
VVFTGVPDLSALKALFRVFMLFVIELPFLVEKVGWITSAVWSLDRSFGLCLICILHSEGIFFSNNRLCSIGVSVAMQKPQHLPLLACIACEYVRCYCTDHIFSLIMGVVGPVEVK